MDPRLRGLLVCPRCRGELVVVGSGRSDLAAEEELRCGACQVRWPVVDGVPWLVEEHARRDGPAR